MKIYGILLLIFVLGFVAGCTQSTVVNTPVQNEPIQSNEQMQTPITNEQSATNEPSTNVEPVLPVNAEPAVTKSGVISLSELGMHNERADCWVGYKGKVYDITDFVPKHPGGASKITPYCGTASEFENAFTKKHGTSQVSKLVKEGILMGDLQ